MTNHTEQLRNLPSVDEVMRHADLSDLLTCCPRPQLLHWTRQAIDQCRQQISVGKRIDASAARSMIVEQVCRDWQNEAGETLQPVINATGVLLHTNLGRAPLADRAIQRMRQATGYTNVELNLVSGKRSQRGERATRLMAELSAAEDAVIVNNCAGATLLVLQAIAANREVIVSRGQLVEIGGGFRLPEVFTAAGIRLREVGTTNRTYLRDYETAVSEETGAIMRVHRSNFVQTGFVTEPTIDELVTVRRGDHIPVIDDLGSGCFQDLAPLGLAEPMVTQSVNVGADLTLFSGDKLFGGPQCGIIVGRRQWIEKLRHSPIMRALRVDKLTLAALEATAEIYLEGRAIDEIPLLKMMYRDAADIRTDCQSVCDQLADISGIHIDVIDCQSPIGGGAIPGASLDSFGIRISGNEIQTIAHALRTGSPAVQARVAHDSLILDLRTVSENELDRLVRGLREMLLRGSEPS